MPNRDRPIVAAWEVAGETYQELIDEALSDAKIFLNGYKADGMTFDVEVLNCEPMEWEDSRIIKWKGKAIIS